MLIPFLSAKDSIKYGVVVGGGTDSIELELRDCRLKELGV